MNLSDFDFDLPEHLIAQYPAKKRDQSRLLSVNRTNQFIQHKSFFDLKNMLRPHDLLVMNDSRTMNARLFAKKQSGGKMELLIEQILSLQSAKVMLKCSRKPQVGDAIIVANDVCARVKRREGQWFYLDFDIPVLDAMQQFGHLPLPPYIKRPHGATESDAKRYQTIYADKLGSVATPTAGLHFSKQLISELEQQDVDIGFLTLHVGSGTFQPVRSEKIENHTMHKEFIEINEKLCDQLKNCRQKGGRIIAVGTTSARALESMMLQYNEIMPYYDYSDIFLYPGVEVKLIDGLITNFHLPKSTLFMLVCAFANKELMTEAYQQAIEQSYRFFSYGDAMIIL